jgi:hypothetical protein
VNEHARECFVVESGARELAIPEREPEGPDEVERAARIGGKTSTMLPVLGGISG